jgi:hypothetical protein
VAHQPQHRKRTEPNFRARQIGTLLLLLALIAMLIFVGTKMFGGHASATTTSAPSTTTTVASTTTTTTTDPGTQPQTAAVPPSSNAALHARLMPLWQAIQSGNVTEAESVFFPESAYLSMKTGQIPYPQSDYEYRLVAFLKLDLATYHEALGSSPATVPLLETIGQPAYSTWILRNTCENNVGYWHLPGVRLVYRLNGQVRSFGIASLISWRGVWYVVHLGPNPRPVNIGTLDNPAVGPGTSGPPGGC